MYPVSGENGTIYIFSDSNHNNLEMCFTTPYIYDASGNTTNNISTDLISNGESYKLYIIADSEWINSEERAFPVVIDPTIELDTGRDDIIDAHVNQNKPTKNYETDYQLEVGKNLSNVFRTYIKYTLPTLPNMSIITDAEIELIQNWARSFSNIDIRLNVYQCTSNWYESSITWNNQPISNLSSATVVDYTYFLNGMSKHYILNVTKIAKSWYESGSNYGLMLATSDESVSEKTSFYSSENIVNAFPLITVSYTNNTGVEDYWDYQSISLEKSGEIFVNTYNGSMTYFREDASTSGLIYPVTVSHIYSNSKDSSTGIFGNMKLGKGFKLNLIEKIETTDLDAYPYKYIDSDGTVHFCKATNASGQFQLEFDTTTILSVGASSYTLSYADGSYKSFNSSGFLTNIHDKNANCVSITYSNNRISRVTDGAGKYISFTYNTDNYLQSITDTAGRITVFLYNSSGYLTSVSNPDSTSTSYTYMYGMISRITTTITSLTTQIETKEDDNKEIEANKNTKWSREKENIIPRKSLCLQHQIILK